MVKKASLKPGEELIQSMVGFFDQGKSRGFSSDSDFQFMRAHLITFLLNCTKMTGAKARAASDFKYPDNSFAQATISLPPGGFKIDEKGTDFLKGTTSPETFTLGLQSLVDEQFGDDGKKKKKPAQKGNKRKWVQKNIEELSVDMEPKKRRKTIIKVKRRVNPPSTTVDTAVQSEEDQTMHNAPAMSSLETNATEETPSGNPEPETVASSITVRTDNAGNASTAQTVLPSSLPQDAKPQVADEGPSENPSGIKFEWKPMMRLWDIPFAQAGRPGTPWSYRNAATQVKWGNEEYHRAHEQNLIIQHRIAVVAQQLSIDTSADVDILKPLFADLLSQLELHGVDSQPPLPAHYADRATKRLAFAIKQLGPEITCIPADRWEEYEARLQIYARGSEAFASSYSTRLEKLTCIIYLQESQRLMATREWDKLKSVARICSYIAEVTGPIHERLDGALADQWLKKKLQDIEFFEKMTLFKDRIFGASHVGPEE